jgi:hypothetical protein
MRREGPQNYCTWASGCLATALLLDNAAACVLRAACTLPDAAPHAATPTATKRLVLTCRAMPCCPCSRGHLATVEVLLKHGAKPRGVNKHGLTPLGAALVKGQVEAARRLLSWGAGTSLGERRGGFSLLHLVAGSGQAAAAQLLLDHGADVNGKSVGGPVCALFHLQWAAAQLLLDQSA